MGNDVRVTHKVVILTFILSLTHQMSYALEPTYCTHAHKIWYCKTMTFLVNKQSLCLHTVLLAKTHCVYLWGGTKWCFCVFCIFMFAYWQSSCLPALWMRYHRQLLISNTTWRQHMWMRTCVLMRVWMHLHSPQCKCAPLHCSSCSPSQALHLCNDILQIKYLKSFSLLFVSGAGVSFFKYLQQLKSFCISRTLQAVRCMIKMMWESIKLNQSWWVD